MIAAPDQLLWPGKHENPLLVDIHAFSSNSQASHGFSNRLLECGLVSCTHHSLLFFDCSLFDFLAVHSHELQGSTLKINFLIFCFRKHHQSACLFSPNFRKNFTSGGSGLRPKIRSSSSLFRPAKKTKTLLLSTFFLYWMLSLGFPPFSYSNKSNFSQNHHVIIICGYISITLLHPPHLYIQFK